MLRLCRHPNWRCLPSAAPGVTQSLPSWGLPDHIGTSERASLAPGELPLFVVLATVVTLSASILSMLGVHLLPILQARGLELSAAVGLGALVGPSQVAARVVEMLGGRYYHPVWTMVASTILVAAGIGMLLSDFPTYSAAISLYGAGNGIGSVARGTLPLALFGPSRYPALIGRLAQPILMSMAVSPFVGAIAFQHRWAELTSWASDTYWNHKRAARGSTLDFKRAGADSFWVELGAAYSDATARDLSFGIWEPWGQIKPDPYDPISRSRVIAHSTATKK